MELKRTKMCVVCEIFYEGRACPYCGDEQGIWPIRSQLKMSLAPGRVRRVERPLHPSGTVREMGYGSRAETQGRGGLG